MFPFRPAEYSSSARREDRPFPESDTVAVEEVTIDRFLSSTIVWLDIISACLRDQSEGFNNLASKNPDQA